MKNLRTVMLVLGALLVSACASGPTLSEVEQSISALPEGNARIYFYRTQVFGAAVQPSIILNQEKVGSCKPGGVFFTDVAPGKYEASVETEVERQLTMVLGPGEEKYVRCYISFGFLVGHANLELVNPDIPRYLFGACYECQIDTGGARNNQHRGSMEGLTAAAGRT